MGQTAVSDNQASSVTLNEPANKARKIYCNFEFQQRSHTMTEINLNRAQIDLRFANYDCDRQIVTSDSHRIPKYQ